ncbi:MAG: DUF3857 domain-containing protein [Bryobacteraceae bacterium]
MIRLPAAVLLIVSAAWAADEAAPAWFRDAAAQKLPQLNAKAPAVVLLDEQSTSVDELGTVVERRTRVIKILNNEGRNRAVAVESYIQKAGKLRDLRAWLLQTDGVIHRYGKDKVVETGGGGGGILYDDYRTAIINASQDAGPGTIFGFESVVESRSVFTQFSWPFQDNLPVMVSRFRLTLPAGWESKSVTLRHAGIEPQVSGNTSTWEMRDLPFVERESGGPSVRSMAPRLAVGYFPSAGARTPGRIIRDWKDVAAWKAELADPQAAPDDAISAKAKELTAGMNSAWDKIRAVSRYVQNLKYVAIVTDSAKGGGYKPHAASEIFAKAYGDCKDKATLMRAMLKSLEMESRYITIFSGDRTYADPKWASPQQFNHAILAVVVPAAVQASTVMEVEGVGRLLIFDPTDPDVRLGDLPSHEQGSWALIGGENGKLVRMPVVPAASNPMSRQMVMKVNEDGSVQGHLRETTRGASSAYEREVRRELKEDDYRKRLERWASFSAPGSVLSNIASQDSVDGEFTLDLDFANPRFAKRMNQRLLTVRPTAILQRIGPDVSKPERHRPVLLDAQRLVEETTVDLPAGFVVDEAPEPIKLDTPFGTFEGSSSTKDGKLVVTRRLDLKHTEVAAADYVKLRDFLSAVAGHQNAVAVLVKQ